MSECRSTLPLGHHFLVLLFHDVEVPAHFWSCPLKEAKVINMVVMLLGRTSWMWRIPCCSRQTVLSLPAVMGSVSALRRRSSAGRELVRQEAGSTLASIPAITMLALEEGQMQLSRGSCRCGLSPFGVALSVSLYKVLLRPPACSRSRIPLQQGGTPFTPHRAHPCGGSETAWHTGSSRCPLEVRGFEPCCSRVLCPCLSDCQLFPPTSAHRHWQKC